jgi:hypothetical protein
VTPLLVLADALLTALAGAAVAGLVRARLTLVERVCLTVVAGVILSSAATFALALLASLTVATVLAGPLWITVMAMVASHWAGNPYETWRDATRAAMAAWRRRPPIAMFCIFWVSAVLLGLIYARTIFTQNGAVLAGYQTVWADWAQHLTTASSFAVAGNLPPVNPLFSGTPLLYPFLPDFHAATLMVLGVDGGTALALGSGVLALTLVMLVVSLARRVGLPLGAGVIAVLVTLIGGGLGFVGVFSDACASAGYSAAQCSAGFVLGHPLQGVSIVAATLHGVPGVIAAQPRAYDGLLTASSSQVFANQQWYTPLFAWWLPQRSMLYGFDTALAILILVLTALRCETVEHPVAATIRATEERAGEWRSPASDRGDPVSRDGVPTVSRASQWSTFAVAGVLLGVMPLVHAQTLFALAVLLLVLLLRHRRREWLALVGTAAVVAAPRLLQIAVAPHGSAADGDAYPFFDPGWASNSGATMAISAGNAMSATLTAVRQLGTAQWWGFWLTNLGVAVPLCVVVLLATVIRRVPGAAGHVAARCTSAVTPPLLELLIGAMVIFALSDLVSFQSWYWDNTKLLVYWYLVAGLLAGALAARWWRRSWWSSIAAVVLPASMLFTGFVVLLRLLPWTPAQDSVTGPYTITSAADTAMAQQVARSTPGNAVVLTLGDTNDALQVVAGRTAVMGYYGWLWSYGTVFGTRIADVQAMYAGCRAGQPCTVVSLLHRYHVGYVEIDSQPGDSSIVTQPVNAAWWAAQGYPVVARSPDAVVYDVRSA